MRGSVSKIKRRTIDEGPQVDLCLPDACARNSPPLPELGLWEASFHRTHLHPTVNQILSKPWDLEEPLQPHTVSLWILPRALHVKGKYSTTELFLQSDPQLVECDWSFSCLPPTKELTTITQKSLARTLLTHHKQVCIKTAQKAKVPCTQKVVVNSQEQIIVAFWDRSPMCIASVLYCSTLRNFVSLRSLTWAKMGVDCKS